MAPARLLTVAKAAEASALSTRTLRRYISSGRLTAYRVGPTRIRIAEADLEALRVPLRPSDQASSAA